MTIHPTALVSEDAAISPSAEIGPYCVIDANVHIGDQCRLDAFVRIHSGTVMGADNRFHAGCVIGDAPQDLKYKDSPTRLVIGNSNTFREGFTAHRSTTKDDATEIGDHGYFMANSHVGHNSQVANHVILANGALLGGHVSVGERAFISGNVAIHQYVRVGQLSIIHGCSGITQDVPPFSMVTEPNRLCGLNRIGISRAGIPPDDIDALKRLYREIFLSKTPLQTALESARKTQLCEVAAELLGFMEAKTSRGVCSHKTGRR